MSAHEHNEDCVASDLGQIPPRKRLWSTPVPHRTCIRLQLLPPPPCPCLSSHLQECNLSSASNCCLLLPPPSPRPVPPRTCHLVAQFLHLLTAGAHCREEALTLRLQLLPLSIIEGQVLRG